MTEEQLEQMVVETAARTEAQDLHTVLRVFGKLCFVLGVIDGLKTIAPPKKETPMSKELVERPTPRTDAVVSGPRDDGTYGEKRDLITLARQLERELESLQVKFMESRDQHTRAVINVAQRHGLSITSSEGPAGYLDRKITALQAKVSELQPEVCCQDFAHCEDDCLPRAWHCVADQAKRLQAADAKLKEVERALAELVACKDLADEKDQLQQLTQPPFRISESEMERLRFIRDDYQHRKPRAWKAARAALATETAQATEKQP